MKKSLTLFLAVALTLCGCASLRMTPEEKAAIEAFKGSDNFKGDKFTKDSIFQRFKNYFS